MRTIFTFALGNALALLGVCFVGLPAKAAACPEGTDVVIGTTPNCEQRFATVGTVDRTVPAGVTSIDVIVIGGGSMGPGNGSFGASGNGKDRLVTISDSQITNRPISAAPELPHSLSTLPFLQPTVQMEHLGVGNAGIALEVLDEEAREDYLVGFAVQGFYGSIFLISILVRWPIFGLVLGLIMGKPTTWRSDQRLRRAGTAASWIWVGVFFSRLVVQLPLFFAGAFGVLDTVKIVMGWPLFLGAAFFTYRLLAAVWRDRRPSD